MKGPGNKSSRERNFPGVKVPWSELAWVVLELSLQEWIGPGVKRLWFSQCTSPIGANFGKILGGELASLTLYILPRRFFSSTLFLLCLVGNLGILFYGRATTVNWWCNFCMFTCCSYRIIVNWVHSAVLKMKRMLVRLHPVPAKSDETVV